jgi:hypothetical protein
MHLPLISTSVPCRILSLSSLLCWLTKLIDMESGIGGLCAPDIVITLDILPLVTHLCDIQNG